ncbi:cation-transporting P-type ATPase [Fodinicurvata sp. EGI_FJ10296]|uniref:cation-transporting P-type ATPase n=1 Tax=Fodinicurvata sp. EGI_FJ10296 TaxID=3231908 RepID=UPI0034572A9B
MRDGGAGTPWHARGRDDVIAALDVSPEAGLSEAEAEARLARHGPNALPEPPRRGALARLAAQFNNVLIYVLIAAGAVAGVLGEWVDAAVIGGVVVINALIGFVQEGKAEEAIDAIRDMLSPEAQVTRGGERRTVSAQTLVPGDVAYLKAGDRVPADLRVIESRSLQVQEAALTGESSAVDKSTDPVNEDAPLAERVSMLYSGTLVSYGTGSGVVVETGAATELGRISGMIGEDRGITTPLLEQMGVFGRWLTLVIVVLAGITLAFGLLFRDYTVTEMFMAAVSVAVAAIPEGLPAIMTITLAIGVTRMARRNAIIRRLPAVETLGAVSVICSDKTGTLTRNELMVSSVVTTAGRYSVAGSGYDPKGAVCPDDRSGDGPGDGQSAGDDPAEGDDLRWVARVAALCNEARIRHRDGAWTLSGNPTDGALLAFAAKAGMDADAERTSSPALQSIPFDSAHKYMATSHDLPDEASAAYGGHVLLVKGAPERLLEMCDTEGTAASAGPIDRDRWHRVMDDLARNGQRLIGVAMRPMEEGEPLTFDSVSGSSGARLTFLGVLGLIDPARPDAIEAVATCRAAGIEVKMITGDHAATATAIARDFGIVPPDGGTESSGPDASGSNINALTGRDLDAMNIDDLAAAGAAVSVFARTSPENKLQLVTALQKHGHVVAMTGDGVNDAPALKRADVGVAMGIKGTEAAKEAAEMVLADDNFASIARAVEEGRTVYDNLKKAILFILPTSFGQALVVLAAILAGMTLPITPVQILWVNMITAVTLALTLAFEPAEADIMRRPPRPRAEPLLSRFLVWRIAFVSFLLLAGAFSLFVHQYQQGVDLDTARTVAVNALVVGQVVYLLNTRHMLMPSWTLEGLFGSKLCLAGIAAVLLLQMIFTYVPFMNYLFESGAMTSGQWGLVVAFGAALFLIVEAEKLLVRRIASPHRSRRKPAA